MWRLSIEQKIQQLYKILKLFEIEKTLLKIITLKNFFFEVYINQNRFKFSNFDILLYIRVMIKIWLKFELLNSNIDNIWNLIKTRLLNYWCVKFNYAFRVSKFN